METLLPLLAADPLDCWEFLDGERRSTSTAVVPLEEGATFKREENSMSEALSSNLGRKINVPDCVSRSSAHSQEISRVCNNFLFWSQAKRRLILNPDAAEPKSSEWKSE